MKLVMVIAVSIMLTPIASAGNNDKKKHGGLMVIDKPHNLASWRITSDNVMGGVSNGKVQVTENEVVFSGHVSIENNGGFTSVFKKIPPLPNTVKSVTLRIMGDGNRYQLRLRSPIRGYMISYMIELDTVADTVQTHQFNLADFKASFRGRIIGSAPPLVADKVSHAGILIASKKSKSFVLSIFSMEFK